MKLPRLARTLGRRYGPRLPSTARKIVDTVARIDGGRPLVGLPNVRRALVIAPHPDDESLGCGGTIALLAQRGATVGVCFATDGERIATRASERSEIAHRRREEGAAACRALGADRPTFFGLPNEELPARIDELADKIGAVLSSVNPEIVFAPWPLDAHPDHRATATAVARAGPRGHEIWAYEIWTPLWANRLVDISAVTEIKRSAIAVHTADPRIDPDLALSLNRYRSATGLLDGTHAEAFLVVSSEELAAIVE